MAVRSPRVLLAAAEDVCPSAPGDYLLFDNTRYLHGRTAIDPGARRLLKRTYFRHRIEAAQ